MSEALLDVRGLALRVGTRTLVRDLNFSVRAGEVWCLLGRNGAGKTTLLHTMVGLRDAQGGEVRLAGRELGEWPGIEAARQRGFLPQSTHDAFSATVLDTVLVGRHPYLSRWQWENGQDRALALAALDDMDLAGFQDRDVLTLSGGERQRVAIAALLVQDPPLMLLAAPVAHLDLHHQILVLHHLSRLARERGKAVLLTLHDLNLAARFASHALLFGPGATLRQGPIAEVLVESELENAFGHRVTRLREGGRAWFLPE